MADSSTATPARRFGGLGDLALKVYAGLVLLFLFLPIFVIVLFSFNKPNGKFNLVWQQFSLDAWLDPFAYPQLTEALVTSLEVAAVSTAIAVVLGTFIAIALVRQRFRGREAMDVFLVLPLTAAEVVMGASLLTMFLDLGLEPGLRHDRAGPRRLPDLVRRPHGAGPGAGLRLDRRGRRHGPRRRSRAGRSSR